MSLSTDCENAILEYAPLIRQVNASFLGEHVGYYELDEAGETEWSIPDALRQELDADKPY
jgi:hypothetical protein